TELDGEPTLDRLRELAERFARTEPTGEQKRRYQALASVKAPEEERSADTIWRVSRGLNPLLDGRAAHKKSAALAMQKWGTPDNLPGLERAVEASEEGVWDTRLEVMRALAKIGGEPAARAVARRLGNIWDDRGDAVVQVLCDFSDKAAAEGVMIDLVK